MTQEPSQSLVPLDPPSLASSDRRPLSSRFGTSALVALGKSPAMRKAALIGAAFGVGYQVSRLARSSALPRIIEDVKDVYQVANGGDPSADGWIAGSWVRESFTMISAVYGVLDHDERFGKR